MAGGEQQRRQHLDRGAGDDGAQGPGPTRLPLTRTRAARFAACALLAALAACGGEPAGEAGAASGTSVSADAPASSALLWRELGAWSGRGGRQTESFEVASGALRLTWSARDETADGTGTLRVSLHSAISGRPLEVVVEHVGAGSDTARVAVGPRVAYLLVESSGVAWGLVLEEGVAAGRGGGS